jgi:O-antigen ligase
MRRLILVTLPLTLFVALFTFSAYLATAATYDSALIGDSLNAIFLSFGLYLIIVYLLATRRLTRLLYGLLLGIGAVFAVLFISQFRYQDYTEVPDIILTLGNATSLLPNLSIGYLHPNAAATFLEALIPLGIAFFVRRRNWGIRIGVGAITLLMVYALLLTFSRGAFVGLFAAFVMIFIVLALSRLSLRVASVLVIAVLTLIVIAIYVLLTADPASSSPLLASVMETAGSRLTLYRNSLFLTRDYAFTGIGLGSTFAMVYSRYSLLIFVPFLTYSHNLLLAVWLNQGLLGIIALLGIIITYYLFIVRVMRSTKPSLLFHGTWLGVTATLVHGLTDARQYTESPWIMPMLFVMIGLTVALGLVSLRENEVNVNQSRILRTWLLVSAALIGIGVIVTFISRTALTAAWYTNQGALEETRGELQPDLSEGEQGAQYIGAQDWYQKALELDPNYPPANRRLGNLLVELDTDYEDAVVLLETAYAGEPTNPAAIKGLGLAYVWVGRLEDAVRLLSILPPDAKIEGEMYTWGTYRMNDQAQPLLAAYAWETGQRLGGKTETNIWLAIGDMYRQADAIDRARAAYEVVLSVEPDNPFAQDGLSALDD